MARRRKDCKPGYAKLLDAWLPPNDAGDPVGCVATSFTFSPVAFEEECLGAFLNLESDPDEDGAAYIIEREEKLAQLVCAAALVDQHHAKGVRSLRWDLLPARPVKGILHAKVSLLLWTQCARVIVGSANITEDGCRRNQEIFGVLDYFEGSEAPLGCLQQTLEFLHESVSFAHNEEAERVNPAVMRWLSFLSVVAEKAAGWGKNASANRNGTISLLALSPNRPSAFDALEQLLVNRQPPSVASVLSPFFDPPEAPNVPAQGLWKLLRQRGEAEVHYDVTAEEVPGTDALLLHAPRSLKDVEPRRESATTHFHRLVDEASRPLHAKGILLKSDNYCLYMIGSSNFTTPGLGLSRVKNIEANLVYLSLDEKTAESRYLAGEDLEEDLELRWQPNPEEGTDTAAAEDIILPPQFEHAFFGHDEETQSGFIELTFRGNPPAGWRIYSEDADRVLINEMEWKNSGAPVSAKVPWLEPRPPSVLLVSWRKAEGKASWPVNVLSSHDLPPPSELRDLPLEILIEILTSAKPAHKTLARWLGRNRNGRQVEKSIIDPHKRVDTSSFLLQRTRRISWALAGLRAKLERPIPSPDALYWRLRGPLGAAALASAIVREGTSPAEQAFLIAELVLELSRVKPQEAPGSLPAADVRAAIKELTTQLKLMSPTTSGAGQEFDRYVELAFAEALR